MIFEKITPYTVILTPNRRLSATLHKLYQQHQLEHGHNVWETPTILPVSTWVQRQWQDYTRTTAHDFPLILNTVQEQYLWEMVLTAAKETNQLLQITETAELAKSAYGLLIQWQIAIEQPIFQSSEDYHALQTWIQHYRTLCADHGYIDSAVLINYLIEKIKTKEITPPSHIMLVGFNELSPQLTTLFSHCECVETQSLTKNNLTTHQIALKDFETEIITMARFAKATLTANPASRIGCVVPTLEATRDRVEQLFSQVFDGNSIPFNISAGKPLLAYPVINSALQLLSMQKSSISQATLKLLLTTPFIGEAELERIKRAKFDALLRQQNVIKFDLRNTTYPLDTHCGYLDKRLKRYLELLQKQPAEQTYTAWATSFNELLTALGWPGERSLNSEEYQIVDSWLTLLMNFSSLDQLAKPTHMNQAWQILVKMAGKTVFQPKTPEAPIQVLGILEAAALPFDYLWIAGMNDVSWPPQPKPNPFIPKRLQRELNMPHATPERELHYCEELTQQFKQSATHVIFSSAETQDELELHPSPLIHDLPPITIEALSLSSYLSPTEQIYQSRLLETIEDNKGPDIQPTEKIRGGVSILKQQALCPFKAFAEWRLHAHELENPLPGLRAKDRGTIVHKALELLWGQLRDHATLIAMDEQALTNLIADSVVHAISAYPHGRQQDSHYLLLEKQRLQKLLWDWLQVEKSRAPFAVMMSEKSAQITLNKITLSIRIDRIDTLADGKKLIIDYKTGKNNDIYAWFSDRPEEPQLPLYALLDIDNTTSVTFAQVFTGAHCFKGISHYALDIDGIKLISEIKKATSLSWPTQLQEWHQIMLKLSDDFYAGIATVDPKNPPETCQWCALKPLCRISENTYE